MKRMIFLILGILAVLGLSACAGAGAAQESSNTNSSEGNVTQTDNAEATTLNEGVLSDTAELMLGTMLLKDTDNAVDAAQAGTLLTLWKAYRSLSDSQTAAAEELSALLDQIKETMNAQQLAAIETMQLTSTSLRENMQKLGIEGIGSRFMNAEQNPEVAATIQALRDSGEAPPGIGQGGEIPEGGVFEGGSPPAMVVGGEMGGQFIAPEDMDPEQLATLQAQRGARGVQGANLFLLNALITFLEEKAAS